MPDPAYIYDPEEWDATFDYGDRDYLAEESLDALLPGVKRFKTLVHGPDKFAAMVAVTFDEDGNPDELELQWFDSEQEAQAAVVLPATVSM